MKKALALVLCIVICASALISGTVAFFTDEEAADNIFTVGYVNIEQYEQDRNDKKFEQNQSLNPLVDTDNTKDEFVYKAFDGGEEHPDGYGIRVVNTDRYKNYIDKIVTVENIGENAAYLRNIVAVPTGGVDLATVPWLEVDFCDAPSGLNGINPDWELDHVEKGVTITSTRENPVESANIKYDLYVFNYVGGSEADNGKLQPTDTTLPTLLGFNLSSKVDFEETITGSEGNYKDPFGNSVPAVIKNSAGTVLGAYFYRHEDGSRTYIDITSLNNNHILVASQAVQADGFASFDQAFANAFNGPISDTNHPWYEAPAAPSEPTVAEDAAGNKYTWAQLNPKVEDGKLTSIDVDFIKTNGITKLTLPNDVTSIDSGVFRGCSSLQNISMPEVTSIGNNAFQGCASLETVSMPKVTIIGNYAFYGCALLSEVHMPSRDNVAIGSGNDIPI